MIFILKGFGYLIGNLFELTNEEAKNLAGMQKDVALSAKRVAWMPRYSNDWGVV